MIVGCSCARGFDRHAASPQHYDARAGALDFTGCQMVLFLKLISMAVCYQDFRTKKKEVGAVTNRRDR